jgi:hypothetical protein
MAHCESAAPRKRGRGAGRSCYVGVVSKQLRIRVVGLLVVVLSGFAAVAMIVPACGFNSPNLRDVPSDGADIPDAPPDMFVHDAAPCSSLIKTCVTTELLRECQQVGTLPRETVCDWGCDDTLANNGRCKVFTPSGGAVTQQDLDRPMAMAAGLQKRTFTSLLNAGTINTETGQIQIGADSRGAGTGVINGVDFKVVNGVGVFRFMELEIKGIQDIRATGSNALALVAIDKITIGDRTQIDMRGNCQGRNAGPGGRSGGMANSNGTGNGAGGAGDNTGVCSGGGGGGNSRTGGPGGGRLNGGGTTGNATISTLVGGAGGGGGGGNGGDGGGGGGAIQLVSNGPIVFDAGTLSQVGINAGGCGGKAGNCGGGAGAGGVILLEGRTVDLSDTFFTVNGGGGGGAANGTSGDMAQTVNRANGGNGGIGPGSNDDGGDGGDGGDDGSTAGMGLVRDMRGGGGGGGVGWIRINTKSGAIGGAAFFSPSNPSQSVSIGMANVQ